MKCWKHKYYLHKAWFTLFCIVFNIINTYGQEKSDSILHERLELIFVSYSHEEPFMDETIGLSGFSSFNLKMSLFPINEIPLGLRLGFSFREINRTNGNPRYSIPENDLDIEVLDFQNFNLFTRSYLQMVYTPVIRNNKINPFVAIGIARGRIKSGFNLEERTTSFDFWNERFDGINSSSWAKRGELGITTKSQNSFFRFYAGITWFRTFQPLTFVNTSERQTCTGYTDGSVLCPEFNNAEAFPIISSEVPFYVVVPKYESIINLIGLQFSIAFSFPNYS